MLIYYRILYYYRMKYIVLPFEKVVKSDAEGFSYPVCPICGTDKMNIQIASEISTNVYCRNDNFTIRFSETGVSETVFALYRYEMVCHVEKQEKALKKLFTKGLITYVDLLGYLKFGREEIKEKEVNVLSCEMVKCKRPRSTHATIYNGFEPKTVGVCEPCKDKYGVDL